MEIQWKSPWIFPEISVAFELGEAAKKSRKSSAMGVSKKTSEPDSLPDVSPGKIYGGWSLMVNLLII